MSAQNNVLEQRQEILSEALAHQRLEGGEVSQETPDSAQLWAMGQITAEELVQVVRERYVQRQE